MFVAESMKQGRTMGESASAWKNLDAAQQQEYKDKATLGNDEANPAPKSKPASTDASTSSTRTKTGK